MFFLLHFSTQCALNCAYIIVASCTAWPGLITSFDCIVLIIVTYFWPRSQVGLDGLVWLDYLVLCAATYNEGRMFM
jgi:hypothetical protein